MTEQRTNELLARFTTGKTSPEEERELFLAASCDQKTFDSLADLSLVRELLDDPENKAVMLKAMGPLPEPSRWWHGLFGWQGLAVAAAGAAIVFAVLIVLPVRSDRWQPSGFRAESSSLPVAAEAKLSDLIATAPAADPGVSLDFASSKSIFKVGDDLSLTFGIDRPASLLLLEAPEGRPWTVLFPLGKASPSVRAGELRTLPPGTLLRVPGQVSVHLLVFPPDARLANCISAGRECPAPVAAKTIVVPVHP